jgi:hypothetical protein
MVVPPGVFQFRGNRANAFDFAAILSLSLKNIEIRLRKFGLPNFPLWESGGFWTNCTSLQE